VGRAKFAGKYAEHLGLPLVVVQKRREDFSTAKLTHIVGDIVGKIPIIIDDVIAGGSVLDEVNELVAAGARQRCTCQSPTASSCHQQSSAFRIPISSNWLSRTRSASPKLCCQHPKIKVVSVADLLAQVNRQDSCGLIDQRAD